MRRIDAHAHVMTPRLARRLASEVPDYPVPPDATLPYLQGFMEDQGIDAAVVSVAGAMSLSSVELVRLANEELAETRRDSPQIAALAMLPLPSPDAALTELAHALDILQLDGVVLLSNHGGVYLGDARLDELFAELSHRRARVFVHPTLPPQQLALGHPSWVYELPFDTTRALMNMIYAGTFERFPQIQFQFAHLGGAAPFLIHRLASLADREPDWARHAPAGAVEYLRRQRFDTGLANNRVAVTGALELISDEHILLGSDWPYLFVPPDHGVFAELSFLDERRLERICWINALSVFPGLEPRMASSGER